uniref:Sushi domain-containing protein n=1 Tax=Amazona collaria TaxID=241587 RepID=A0A8B9F3T5_9PSIT
LALPGMALRWLCAVLLMLPGACGDCAQPPRFAFAELTGSPQEPYTVGTRLRYKCRPGYTLGRGKSPVVTCVSNSSWSMDPDFCIGKSCGPPDIMNGKFEYTTNLLFGARVTYTCNTGYRLFGASSVQCILKNNEVTWEKLPHCEIIPCLPPPPIMNGQFSNGNSDFTFGMTVTYSCNEGLALIGDATIHCTADEDLKGQWSGPAPECRVVRCEYPEVKNGRRLSGFGTRHAYKDTVTFECNPGHFLNGSSVVTCEADGMWEPPLPTCDPFHCGPAPHFPFAELTSDVAGGFVAGTELKYQCKPGYTAASGKSSVVTCLRNGTWSADVDFCIRQQCAPPMIENGNVTADNFLFETVVMFTCHPGAQVPQTSVSYLMEMFLLLLFRLLPDTLCEEPPGIENGMHNGTKGTDFSHGTVVAYKCKEGFTLAGAAFLQCIAGDKSRGDWNKPAPECRGDNLYVCLAASLSPVLLLPF